jgi:type II secretory pathway component PulJ
MLRDYQVKLFISCSINKSGNERNTYILSGIMYHRKGSTERLLAAEDCLHREEQLQELTNEIAANREKETSSGQLMMQEGVEKPKATEINSPIEGTSVPIVEVFDYYVEAPSIEEDNQFPDIWDQNESKVENKSDDIIPPTSYVSCTQRYLKVSPKEITVKEIKKGGGLSVEHDKVKSHVSFARSSLQKKILY